MRAIPAIILTAICMASFASSGRQQSPSLVLNRVASAYRGLQSYSGKSSVQFDYDGKKVEMPVALALSRPAKYLLDVNHPQFGVKVASDGTNLVALRTQRKAYTTNRAPIRLMGADLLGKLDVPAPASRLITMGLEGRLSGSDPLAAALAAGQLLPAKALIGGVEAHVITFQYGPELSGKLYVGVEDNLIKRVEQIRAGKVEVSESVSEVGVNQPVADAVFAQPLPPGARLTFTLPAGEPLVIAKGPSADDFEADRLDGNGVISLKELKGKVVVLNFWFNDCPPCIAEAPHMAKMYDELKDQGLEIVAVNGTDAASDALAWLKKYGARFPGVASGQNQAIEKLFKIDAYPTNIVIDREGKVTARIVGYGQDDDRLAKALAKLGIK